MRFLFVLIFILCMTACQNENTPRHYTLVKIANTTVNAVISNNDAERIRGLKFVNQLPKNGGMLFIYEHPRILSHWMKDMRIPLDIIWINQNKKVVNISANVPICQENPCPAYSSGVEAQYALEVNTGFATQHHIQPDADVSFNES